MVNGLSFTVYSKNSSLEISRAKHFGLEPLAINYKL
jgi:hypothetical protein